MFPGLSPEELPGAGDEGKSRGGFPAERGGAGALRHPRGCRDPPPSPPHPDLPASCCGSPSQNGFCNRMSLLRDPPIPGCGTQGSDDAPGGGPGGAGWGVWLKWAFLSCSRPRGSWTWRASNFARPRGRAGHWRRSPAPGVSDGVGGAGRETDPLDVPSQSVTMSLLAPPKATRGGTVAALPVPQPLHAAALKSSHRQKTPWGGYFSTRLGIV